MAGARGARESGATNGLDRGKGTAREGAVARFLLVQAAEESDPRAEILPAATRRQEAGAEVLSEAPSEAASQEFLLERAARISAPLLRDHASLRAALRGCGIGLPLGAVVVVSALAGLATDALGSTRQVNLLAIPLLGLLAWNLLAYLFFFGSKVLERPALLRGGSLTSGLAKRALALWQWLSSPKRAWNSSAASATLRFEAATTARFFELWTSNALPLLLARSRRALHLAAACFAGGVVVGMYLAGFAFSYEATWESTFLGTPQVHALLARVLAPASLILGVPVPDAAELARLQAPGGGDAALWIHLWAMTALLFVIGPRMVLALLARLRERRLQNALAPSLDAPYALRILAPSRGEGVRVEVLPYSYKPSVRALASLREGLLEKMGNRIQLLVREPLSYGGDLPPLGPRSREAAEAGEFHVVCVFNLAQSPEQEVHGQLLVDLQEKTGAEVDVLLDDEAYRMRLDSNSDSGRLDQRRRAWERVVREVEIEPSLISGASA